MFGAWHYMQVDTMGVKAKFNDDFLKGSLTLYNYNPSVSRSFLIYPQLVGHQIVGPAYYNEVEFGNTYMLNFTVSGSGEFRSPGLTQTVGPGDLIFIHNYLHHSLKPSKGKPWEFYCIHIFDNDIVSRFYRSVLAKQGFLIRGFPKQKVVPAILSILDKLEEQTEHDDFAISKVLYNMLADITEEAESRAFKSFNPAVDDVVAFIKDNFDKPLPLKAILAKTTYSKNHLERLFKAQMNMTIQEYIFYLRLLRSQELLVSTDMPLKEIADKVGLSEYRSLYHMFKKATGFSPDEYRRVAGSKKA